MAVEFYLGETWTFDIAFNDAAGSPIDLTGADVEFGIARLDGTVVLTRSSTSGVSVATPTSGQARVSIEPTDQSGFSAPAAYIVQARVQTSDGAVSHQVDEFLHLKSSIFA